jgi:hypothetical protein
MGVTNGVLHTGQSPSILSLTSGLQGNAVRGKVSLTYDEWQASNVDGYFAVTSSWIEDLNG